MRSIICAALSAGMAVAGSSVAFAQRESVRIYPDGYEYGYQAPTREYRYYRSEPADVIPIRPANCGEFRYWDGRRCVDAREVPPDITVGPSYN
jgi:hypothetical protein